MEKIIILGMGGHAESLADVLERQQKYEIAGYVVNDAVCAKRKAAIRLSAAITTWNGYFTAASETPL